MSAEAVVNPAGDASTGTPASEVVSATRDAADRGDVSTFLEADQQARREGRVAKVERPKVVAGTDKGASGRPKQASAAQPAASGPTAKDREADDRLRTRIQEAVEVSTAELRRQNQELTDRLSRAAGGAPKDEPKEPAASGPTKLEIKKYREMPDAPKLDDKDPRTGEFLYETSQDHAVAMSLFIQGKQGEERATAARNGDQLIERTKREAARVTGFSSKIEEYKTAVDPEFGKKLTPEVAGIHGFAMLQHVNKDRQAKGLAPIPATVDHAIGELIYDSDYPAHVAVHLSTHPEDLALLRKAQDPQSLAKAFARVEDRAAGTAAKPAAQAAEQPKQTAADTRARAAQVVDRSISSATVPETNLGKPGSGVDAYDAAVAKGDVGMFLELDRQRMAERRGLR